MPAGDRTGPAGEGPRTGRAAGYCAGSAAPGFANAGWRRGWSRRGGRGSGQGWGRGRGWGRSRGWRHRFDVTGPPGWRDAGEASAADVEDDATPRRPRARDMTRTDELKTLKTQARELKDAVKLLTERLTELEDEVGEREKGE